MALVVQSHGVSPGASTTTIVITKPTGLAAGDLMIAHCEVRLAPNTITPPTPATGTWTSLGEVEQSTTLCSELFWRIADSTDAGATDFTFTVGTSQSNLGAIWRITGHDPTTPIGAENSQGNAASTTCTAPTITPAAASSLILLLCTHDNNDAAVSAYAIATDDPGGWTEQYDAQTGAGADSGIAGAYVIRTAVTATGNGTCTLALSRANIGFLVAVTPASTTVDYWHPQYPSKITQPRERIPSGMIPPEQVG